MPIASRQTNSQAPRERKSLAGAPITYLAPPEESAQIDAIRETWGNAPRAAVVRKAVREFLARQAQRAPAGAQAAA